MGVREREPYGEATLSYHDEAVGDKSECTEDVMSGKNERR